MSNQPTSNRSLTHGEFAQRTLVVIGLVTLVVVLALLLWAGADVLLLIFGGILLAVFLRGLSELLSRATRLPAFWSLIAVLAALGLLLGLGGWFLGSAIGEELDQLGKSLSVAWQQIREWLGQYAWGRRLLAGLPGLPAASRGESISRVTSLFSSTVGALFSLVVILFTALYLAFDPGLYRRGMIKLVPRRARDRAGEVLSALDHTLRWWLISQSFSMVVVGVATTVGLWLLGIPLALALGLIAFLFTFVPYVGPIVAAVPAVLVALTVGPTSAMYVALLYFGVQMIEGNLLTPLVQQQMVKLPPGLIIVSQVLMGVILGTPGIVFATPVAACLFVLVNMLYVQDTLGDPPSPAEK